MESEKKRGVTNDAKCFSPGHVAIPFMEVGSIAGGLGLRENQDSAFEYFAFELLPRYHVEMLSSTCIYFMTGVLFKIFISSSKN